MKNALRVLFVVAEELAEKARSSVPKLRDGEVVTREWLVDGVYHRETALGGTTYHSMYSFHERKVISNE